MFVDDEKSAARIRRQRTLFSVWIALAAVTVIATMTAGILTTA